jgi:4a-hydroxytetrahydrobiopterin dehydratase
MQLKIAEGQNDSQVKAEVEALLAKGWKLDEDQIQLEKTYYFKIYTKVLVRDSPVGYGTPT